MAVVIICAFVTLLFYVVLMTEKGWNLFMGFLDLFKVKAPAEKQEKQPEPEVVISETDFVAQCDRCRRMCFNLQKVETADAYGYRRGNSRYYCSSCLRLFRKNS